MSKNYLSRDDELRRGDFLLSNNGQWKAIFQDDANFVIYGWKLVWASDTWKGDGTRLCMQADSNLVMYNDCDQPTWSTGTYYKEESKMNRLHLTDEGNLVLYRDGKEIWNSASSKGKKE